MNDGILTLSADRPITKSDADILGYSPFAQNIATILDNATTREDCLVLGIHGEWGSGKTSAINLIVEKLKLRQENLPKYPSKFQIFSPFSSFVPDITVTQTEIIQFSPWLFSNQENLTTAFFHELEKQLDNSWGNIKGFLKTIAALTLPSLEALSYLNPTTSKLIGNTTQHLAKNLQKRPSLEQAKQALNKTLKAQRRPLLIIIDDIDRLPADEMRQIFRMVKSVADLPYVTYILAFDRKIVERALEKDTDLEGPQWIEKIIQGSFDLPHIIPFRLESFFLNKLKMDIPDLFEQLHQSDTNFFRQYLYPQLKNPRQVNRLINALIVGWLSIKNIVSPMCFIIIESWRLFQHELYEFIKTNATYFLDHTDQFKYTIELSQPDENKPPSELQNKIKFYNQKLNIDLVLFFQISYQDQSGNPVSIFTKRSFYHYFTYNHNTTLLSLEEHIEIEDNLDDIEKAKEIIKTFSNQTSDFKLSKNRALIQDWQERLPSYSTDIIEKIIFLVIDISDYLIDTENSSVGYNIQSDLENLLDKSFEQFNSDLKKELLIVIFNKFPFRFLLMFNFNKLCFRKDRRIIENRDIFIHGIKENKEELKKIYQNKLKELFAKRERNSLSIHILLLFFNVIDQEWIKHFFTQDLNYTICIMQFIIADAITNLKKNKGWTINSPSDITSMHYVADNVNPLKNVAYAIMQDLNQNEEHKKTTQLFLKVYNKYIQPNQ